MVLMEEYKGKRRVMIKTTSLTINLDDIARMLHSYHESLLSNTQKVTKFEVNSDNTLLYLTVKDMGSHC